MLLTVKAPECLGETMLKHQFAALNTHVFLVLEPSHQSKINISMDWFKGKSAGKPHDLSWENNSGFRLKFSQQNQSIDNRDISYPGNMNVIGIFHRDIS